MREPEPSDRRPMARRTAVSNDRPRGVPGEQRTSASEPRKAQPERLVCGASFKEGSRMGWAPPPCGTSLASCLRRADLRVERGASRPAPGPREQSTLRVGAGQPEPPGATGHNPGSSLRQQRARGVFRSEPGRPHHTAQQNTALFITWGVAGMMSRAYQTPFLPPAPAHTATLHVRAH